MPIINMEDTPWSVLLCLADLCPISTVADVLMVCLAVHTKWRNSNRKAVGPWTISELKSIARVVEVLPKVTFGKIGTKI